MLVTMTTPIGVEWRNPDLRNNYNAGGSHDYNDNDKDPSPNLKAKYDNSHGTKCAGLIAAGANGICGVGVAYGAKVAGIRMLDGMVTDMLEGKSFIFKAHVNWIYSCSWGPEDDGKTVEGPGYVAKEAMELAIKKGRYGYGNVFVFASGNGGINDDNCNFDGYANSIFTITIGAVDELNSMPYYAELCSAMLAVTYSNGHSQGDRMVVTTDASSHKGCTYSFSGTSASAPIASGIIALMLQIRNCLTWRDVQHIIVYTAVMVDAGHAQWAENGAGFHHSNQHGFGLLDAYRMTRVAGLWQLVPPSVHWSSPCDKHPHPLNANHPVTLDRNVTRDELPVDLLTLEYVTVTLSISHSYRGLLHIYLLSPHGTNSTLATHRKQDRSGDGLKEWTFSTVRFWAELPWGPWRLVVSQSGGSHDSGVINSWTLTLYGSAIDRDNVLLRQQLVEDSVTTPTWTSLPCPALPAHPEELHLPELDTPFLPVWKQVLLVIGCVLVFVLVIHCIGEKVWRANKTRRLSSLPSVSYSRLTNTQGDDASEGVVIQSNDQQQRIEDPPTDSPTTSPSPAYYHTSLDSHVTQGVESDEEARDDIIKNSTPEQQPLLP
jgi:proprotein convertase subtilisin/kexin type 7